MINMIKFKKRDFGSILNSLGIVSMTNSHDE